MILITDIDGTLARSAWRDEYKPDWDSYHAASKLDKPYETTLDLISSLHNASWTIVAITTRPERWRRLTLDWLVAQHCPIDELKMRPDDDFRSSPELKMVLASAYSFEKEFVLAMDDRDDVLAAYLTLGFTAFHVRHPT
jgi:phosphoglycolate phosphatase-like HAD superfamily hydrolase